MNRPNVLEDVDRPTRHGGWITIIGAVAAYFMQPGEYHPYAYLALTIAILLIVSLFRRGSVQVMAMISVSMLSLVYLSIVMFDRPWDHGQDLTRALPRRQLSKARISAEAPLAPQATDVQASSTHEIARRRPAPVKTKGINSTTHTRKPVALVENEPAATDKDVADSHDHPGPDSNVDNSHDYAGPSMAQVALCDINIDANRVLSADFTYRLKEDAMAWLVCRDSSNRFQSTANPVRIPAGTILAVPQMGGWEYFEQAWVVTRGWRIASWQREPVVESIWRNRSLPQFPGSWPIHR